MFGVKMWHKRRWCSFVNRSHHVHCSMSSPARFTPFLVSDEVSLDDSNPSSTTLIKQNHWLKRLSALLAIIILALAIALAVVAAKKSANNGETSPNSAPSRAELDSSPLSSSLLSYIDSAVDSSTSPCENFYQYSCGRWIEKHPVDPNSEHALHRAFDTISTDQFSQFIAVLQRRYGPVAQFLNGCLDEAIVNSTNSLGFLLPWLRFIDEIDGVSTSINGPRNFWYKLGVLQGHGLGNFIFSLGAVEDVSNPEIPDFPAAIKFQRYLMLEDSGEDKFGQVSTQNVSIMLRNLQAALSQHYGYNLYNSSLFSSDLLAAESAQSWAHYFLDLPRSNDTRMLSLSSADPLLSLINIGEFLRGVGNHSFAPLALAKAQGAKLEFPVDEYTGYTDHLSMLGLQSYSYSQQAATAIQNVFNGCAGKVTCQNLESFKLALKLHLILAYSVGISADYTASVVPEPSFPLILKKFPSSPVVHNHADYRAVHCSLLTIRTFDNVFLHQWFVENFHPGTKQTINELVDLVYEELGRALESNEFLDTTTRVKALNKFDLITKNVMYSSSWNNQDYGLFITGNKFLTDFVAAQSYKMQRTLLKLEVPVDLRDPEALGASVATINAFYLPEANSINLIPGLLQFPFFSPENPMILNMASYGFVIGHELIHGFDDQGRLYDGLGREINWWTATAEDNFNERAQCLVSQYDNITVEGIAGNGSKTLGENIADNAGVNLAWHSYKKYMKDNKISTKYHPKYTNDQLFWLWTAQSWCASTNSKLIEYYKEKDVHSPAAARIKGPFSNSKYFAESWGCKADQYYGRSLTPQHCKVW
jgi:predicted metalloendopeptidase